MNKKNGIKNYQLILILICVLLIIINLIIYLKKIALPKTEDQTPSKQSNIVRQNNTTEEVYRSNDDKIKYLVSLSERDRMQYYCGTFFKFIKHKDYEAAYNLLYSDFKTNYFPTLEDFQKYIEEKFPKYFGLEYDDISRQGNIYVLRLKIVDANNLSAEEEIQRIVIQENNYNDFVMSFQVK